MADSPFLLTPGPVPVPPEVLAIQASPQQHHRSAAFVATYGEVLRKLKLVYRTRERRAAVHGLGHGRVRVGVREHVEAGDRVLCVTAAHSATAGSRWRSAFGADVTALECEWGARPIPRASPRRWPTRR